MPIPPSLAEDFRVATTPYIKSWSYGLLRFPRQPSATFDDNVKGTLHDQRIFGPIHDLQCACGELAGERYANMICHLCGVKCARLSVRATRFGHIDFIDPIRHPFAQDVKILCFPVLPATFLESPGGQQLQDLYDQLIERAASADTEKIADAVMSIADYLTPPVVTAHHWNLADCETLAHGLALERPHTDLY